MAPDAVHEVWEAIRRYEGVPKWWAELFANVGLTAAEAATWVETAGRDTSSVLSKMREKDLNVTLRAYANVHGVPLLGVGESDDLSLKNPDRFVHCVSTVLNREGRDDVINEVSGFADVKFREKLDGVYSQHSVPNAVRSVHQGYLRKALPKYDMKLEAGASVRSAVLSGVDPKKNHCCNPVLDVRDSVRHSLRGWLTSVASPESKYTEASRVAARAALDPTSGFVCRSRVQDCTKQVDVISSNESTHDIPFDDLPLIMSRHGARLWVGFATRAPGVRRVGGLDSGKSKVFGTRWKLDRRADTITFHFNKDGGFSYKHKFSEWVKYEEMFGHRWQGRYFDYVYTRTPLTTPNCLAFVVVRVPKMPVILREPVYKHSGYAGMVEITSVRAVGSCVGSRNVTFEPFVFKIEEVIFDKAMETRLALGERGNLASTMAYMRSARVRSAVNGVALGAVSVMPVEYLEPAAVAVEVLAADSRRSGERDYEAIMSASSLGMGRVLEYFSGVMRVGDKVRDSVRAALMRLLQGPSPVIVTARRCTAYVEVNDGMAVGSVDDRPSLKLDTVGCGCSELAAVRAALAAGALLSKAERKELREYEGRLSVVAETCLDHGPENLACEDEGEFFDAVSDLEGTETVVDSVFTEDTAGTVASDDSSVSGGFGVGQNDCCVSLCVDGDISSESCRHEGVVFSAVKEYARWARTADRCARTEALRMRDVLFLKGIPTEADLMRATTSRTRHAAVTVIDGKIVRVQGGLREEDNFSEVVSGKLGRTCVVYKDAVGNRYLKEGLTEICYTSNILNIMNGDELCRASVDLLQELPRAFSFPRYTFVNGVPGCGKTYEITERCVIMALEGKSVMYLTQTKASCEEVTSNVAKALGKANGIVAKTYDSYLINGAVPVGGGTVDMLFMDEAPMAHKGQLFACMLKARALSVKLYGDVEQICWLPFMADFDARHAHFAGEFEVERRVMTHRFGPKICAMWLDVYGQIYSCSCCDHSDDSPEVIKISAVGDVPLLPDGKVLTFTQEEKVTVKREMNLLKTVAELKSMDRGGLSTVAEDQGGSHDSVFVVRSVVKKNPKESRFSPSIYNKQPWVLVATTRSRGRLSYYTAAGEDLVVARIALANCSVRLEAVKEKNHWDDVKDKAMSVRTFGV